ncbi:N-acetylmuramoyl-L-alanine amidase [Peijinzhouia sedimentorum]
MRNIDFIFIHCTAGYGDVAAIRKFWREKLKWKADGYHYFIYEDGTIEQLNDISVVTNGVRFYNSRSVHIAYQGGVNKQNYKLAEDTRTDEQKAAIIKVITEVFEQIKETQKTHEIYILGHREASIDSNGNGIIESWERIKECPSFDAWEEYNWMQTKPGKKPSRTSYGNLK